ncbi:MAG: tRNA glutamyl-Q(34) synthetase GluQRS [Phycisphaeraceae bacterium]|nr:tRNA glutamyl-Q(34) synthetase GluQRS [Phycisphaeraceae bacterium]
MPATACITRLAPSPTGALHLGNAQSFLINWALARRNGWKLLLRVEDLDTPRTKPDADRQALEDLRWLGLDWDEGPVYQSADLRPYRKALERLKRAGLVYPCRCTRRDLIESASAPHGDAHELRYPGTCRPPNGPADESGCAWRLVVSDETVEFVDQIRGPRSVCPAHQVGDFVVWTKADLPSYQLAVVVDDAASGVSDVVRGDDLIDSTGRQILLYRLLSLGPPPRYWHLPMVVGPDGRRLAKRHGDTRIAAFREAGCTPQQVIGLIGNLLGLEAKPEPMVLGEFLQRLRPERLPAGPITLTQHHLEVLGTA